MEFFPLAMLIVFVLLLLIFWPRLLGSAEWWPTSARKVRKMLKMAGLKQGETLYDLGCGDGRIVRIAAKEFKAKAIGIELDPIRFLISKLRTTFTANTKIFFGNFFKKNLSNADVIAIFLRNNVNNRLKEKFLRELKPGTHIVSHHWTFESWKPVAVDSKERLYLYQIGKV